MTASSVSEAERVLDTATPKAVIVDVRKLERVLSLLEELREPYVQAARAVGVGPTRIIFRHIVPNTFHILLVQGTIAFVSAIKSEVILTFLGLGIKDSVSWGTMLAESTNDVLRGHFGNFLGASGFLFLLVIAFNMFADALQDALDPKKVS